MGVTWLVVSEWIKHVDATRPIAWHRAILRSELRAPRPLREPRPVVVTTSAERLLADLQPRGASGPAGADGGVPPAEHPGAGSEVLA